MEEKMAGVNNGKTIVRGNTTGSISSINITDTTASGSRTFGPRIFEVINKSFSEITRQLIKRNSKYNLIFIDPPYDYFDEKSLNGIIRTALKLLENQGIIVCEHPMKEEIKLDVANYRVKKYKDKYITFCEML